MAMLPNPSASQAILVGAAEYDTLDQLPAVKNNLMDLQATLTDPEVWGLPVENCHVLTQPDNVDSVLNALQQVAATATDTLVFYYAGHGLVDPGNDDELHLALPSSDIERAFRTAVPYSWVRREIQAARVRRKIVILDCCYSGRALGRWMGDGDDVLADRLEIAGTCVLTATARTRRALAIPNERFTAFTGELLEILTGGVPGGPDLLDMDTLFRQLTVRLRAKSLPLPQRGQLDHGGNVALARNRAASRQSAVASGRHDGMEPTNPTDLDVETPDEPTSWRGAIEPDRDPEVQGLVKPANTRRSRTASILSLPIWTALAAGLAWTQQPTLWLAVAAALGFSSLWLAFRGTTSWAKLDTQGGEVEAGVAGILIVATLIVYILTAVRFTNSGWVSAWIAGLLILLVLVILGRLLAVLLREDAHDDRKLLGRQKAVAETTQQSRWLGDPLTSSPGSELLRPLEDIPAARFAGLPEGSFPFVAVSGSRVALVAFVNWSPGTYTRDAGALADIRQDGKFDKKATEEVKEIIGNALDWSKAVAKATFQVTIVVQPSTSTRAGKMSLQIDANYGDNVTAVFTTPDRFEEAVGPYLAQDAYVLNAAVLEKLEQRLHRKS